MECDYCPVPFEDQDENCPKCIEEENMKDSERKQRLEEALAFVDEFCKTVESRTGILAPIEAWKHQEIEQTLAHEVRRLRREVKK